MTVAALGWAPAQALAADGPIDPLLGSVAETTSGAADLVDPVQGTVDQAAETVSSTADTLSDPLPDPVDEVVDTTSDTVDGVSGTTSGTVDPVSDATSGTVDAVAGSTTDVVGGVTGAIGTTDSGLSDPSLPTGASVGGEPGASSAGSSVSDGTGEASSTRAMESGPSGGAALLEAREGAVPASDIGTTPCVTVTPTTCETTSQTAQDSLAGRVAEIIRKLLAFTGWGALPWIVAALVLSIVGIAAVRETGRRPRYSGSASGS
ncbi:MAG TPA: hypothetical protein VF195_05800 [Actinomycetota bacterium]